MALIAFVVAFDWNWLRPSLERYLSTTSHRSVRIGDLHVSVGPGWQPSVRLRQVSIENAAWAAKRPFAEVGEVAFTFDPASLLDDIKVVTRLRLVDATVSMERQADGLRNWRLTRPDDRGPGHISVQRLEAHRSHIVFVDKVLDLDIDARSMPLETPATVEGVALANRVTFSGRWRTATFRADVAAAETLTLRDTAQRFPLRGTLATGDATLDVDGQAGDIFRQVAFDSHVQLRGQSLAALQPWARMALPSSRPYRIDAQMVKDGARVDLTRLAVTVGHSDAAGSFGFERRDGRTTLRADLASRRIDVGDVDVKVTGTSSALASVFASPSASASALTAKSASAPTSPPATLPSSGTAHRFDTARLRNVDADIALRIARLEGTPIAALQGVQLKATAKAGLVSITGIDLGLAGGRLSGSARLDATRDTATAATQFALQHIQVGGLLPERGDKKRVAGFVDGRVDLTAQGDSLDAWLASATGSAHASLEAGSISKLLDSELALNGAQVAGALLTDAEQIPIRCANVTVDVRNGSARFSQLALDTDKTTLTGRGAIDLRAKSIDLLLTPRSKSAGLLTLRRSIHVSGPLAKPAVKLVDRSEAPLAAPCKS